MYDVLSIAAIVDELGSELVNARIQQVAQPDDLTIALEVYAARQRRWLVLSAHPEQARVLLTSQRVNGDAERVSPLLLLLRKYARGGRIVSVSQPRYERIIRVSIAKPLQPNNSADDDDETDGELPLTTTTLFIELMGRRSNIILVSDEGRILDAIKRVTPEMSRVRPIRPGAAYVPPPPQDKIDPLTATEASIVAALPAKPERLEKWLVARYLGMSPALAREAAVRADLPPDVETGAQANVADALANAIRSLFTPLETGDWQPTLYRWPSGRAGFAPIRMASFEREPDVETHPDPSIFAVAEAAWTANLSAGAAGPQRHAVRRERLVAEIGAAGDRVRQRLHSLNEQSKRAEEAEELRETGEAIYAWISDLQQGMTAYTTPDGRSIALDPMLTPSQNAQEYFERYRKARSAEENLPALVKQAQQERDYLDQLRSMASLAETYDEIESVRLEWIGWAEETRGAGQPSRPKGARPSRQARQPRAYRTIHGDNIYVGRTGQQNDEVTFTIGNPDDLWLHARNLPGAHVILRANGQLSEETIERAASLAAWYSDGRNATAVPVDVTERRHVRKIRGAGPGMVTYRNERTVNVRPLSEQELGLEPAG